MMNGQECIFRVNVKLNVESINGLSNNQAPHIFTQLSRPALRGFCLSVRPAG